MDNNIERIGKLKTEYDAVITSAKGFCTELSHQISELLKQSDISLAFPIENRVKELDSIIDKLDRNETKISTLQDMTDLIGLRIILLFRRDVKKSM